MEALAGHLLAADWLSLRDVARLLLLSGCFSIAVLWAFPKNARSRRALLLAAVAALTFLPWLASRYLGVWHLPMADVPALTLALVLPNLLLWIWIGVACIKLLRLALGVSAELRDVRRLPLSTHAESRAELLELCDRLAVPPPELREGSASYATTLATRCIVLPVESRHWDEAMRRSVLAHELVHISRRDDRWLLLVRVLVLAYWWMPWLNLFEKSYASAMEESCDDAASELIGHDLTYVSALASAAGAGGALRLGVGMHSHHLVGRIARFGDTRLVELDTGSVYWLVIGILVAVTFATSFEPVTVDRGYVAQNPPAGSGLALAASERNVSAVPALYPETRSRIEIPEGAYSRFHDQLAKARYAPPVVYPGRAIRDRTEGEVTVEFSVNRDGTTSRAIVVASQPAGVFDAAALRAVAGTRYSPSYTTSAPILWVRRTESRPPDRVYRHFSFRLEAR